MKKQKFPFKKILITTTIATSTLVLSTLALADNTSVSPLVNGAGSDGSANTAAVNKLGNDIRALSNEVRAISLAGVKTVNDAMHQINNNLPTLKLVNSEKKNINSYVQNKTQSTTTGQIKYAFQQFPDSTMTYNFKTPDVLNIAKSLKERTDLYNSLANLPASDTLYSDLLNIGIYSHVAGDGYLGKPPVVHNNYFDFSSLFAPTAYSTKQQTAANYYLDYLTKRYQTLTGRVNFSKLKSTLNQYKGKPVKLANMLNNFITSPAYQKYQLSVRSMMAQKSVAMSNLNQIMVERTPIESAKPNPTLAKLSEAIGIKPKKEKITDPNDPKKTETVYAYASPLQISNYVANHRVNDPQWYQKMASASPATIQRQSLYTLAEISSQLQQAHLDRERMIATLTALDLQTANSSALLLQTQAQAVNSVINNLNGSNKDQSSKLSNNNSKAKTAKFSK